VGQAAKDSAEPVFQLHLKAEELILQMSSKDKFSPAQGRLVFLFYSSLQLTE
jgi:hypothetical protein